MELLEDFLNPPRPEIHTVILTEDGDVGLGLFDDVFAGVLDHVPCYDKRVLPPVKTGTTTHVDDVSDLDSEEEVFLCHILSRALRSSYEKLPNNGISFLQP
jgi:hypothetical protein